MLSKECYFLIERGTEWAIVKTVINLHPILVPCFINHGYSIEDTVKNQWVIASYQHKAKECLTAKEANIFLNTNEIFN